MEFDYDKDSDSETEIFFGPVTKREVFYCFRKEIEEMRQKKKSLNELKHKEERPLETQDGVKEITQEINDLKFQSNETSHCNYNYPSASLESKEMMDNKKDFEKNRSIGNETNESSISISNCNQEPAESHENQRNKNVNIINISDQEDEESKAESIPDYNQLNSIIIDLSSEDEDLDQKNTKDGSFNCEKTVVVKIEPIIDLTYENLDNVSLDLSSERNNSIKDLINQLEEFKEKCNAKDELETDYNLINQESYDRPITDNNQIPEIAEISNIVSSENEVSNLISESTTNSFPETNHCIYTVPNWTKDSLLQDDQQKSNSILSKDSLNETSKLTQVSQKDVSISTAGFRIPESLQSEISPVERVSSRQIGNFLADKSGNISYPKGADGIQSNLTLLQPLSDSFKEVLGKSIYNNDTVMCHTNPISISGVSFLTNSDNLESSSNTLEPQAVTENNVSGDQENDKIGRSS